MSKELKLANIFNERSYNTVIVAADGRLIDGPEGGFRNIRRTLTAAKNGGADAVLGFPGTLVRHGDLLADTGRILNVTASTSGRKHTRKILIAEPREAIEFAIRHGMDAASGHANFTSMYEQEMLEHIGRLGIACDEQGVPFVVHAYPRKEHLWGLLGKDNNYEKLRRRNPAEYTKLVRHAVAASADLGADIIKTQWTGDIDSFATVVESAGGVPVVMAGGPQTSNLQVLQNAAQAIEAGARGVAVGRSVINNESPVRILVAFGKVVHERKSPEEAMELAGLPLNS